VIKKLLNRRLIRLTLFLIIIIPVFQLVSSCFTLRMSQSEVDEYFSKQKHKPSIETYSVDDRTINFASIGSDSLPKAIFFHGSPGSWTAFIDFMKDDDLLKSVQIISVDRPGFGYSGYGNSVTSLSKQSELLSPLLMKFKSDKPTILIGHSLGGPLIARLAIDYPTLSDALIMVAPSIDPNLEPNEDWFRMPLKTPFLSWILPTSFRVSNDEIYYLRNELIDMLPRWEEIYHPVTVIQGKDDNLVAPENAKFAEKMLKNSSEIKIILKENVNHFIPWNHPDLIKKSILEHVNGGS